jgi:deoxyribonuclease V
VVPDAIACVDVDYRAVGARAACALIARWTDAAAVQTWVEAIAAVEAYQPGEFFRRELPCLLAALARAVAPRTIVIDGYVWLGPDRPGLGHHLWRALDERCPVIGVAKNPFVGAVALPVVRGESARPLWITAAGLEPADAAAAVKSMHGPFRQPTILKHVDRACRDAP